MLSLSDGVFAFAITLLVLDLVVPNLTGGSVVNELFGEWPHYLAYVISFATIGAVWLAHTAITDHMTRTDSTFVRLNLLLLLLVSFMPYPTRFLSAFIGEDHPERVAVSLYGITFLLLTGLVWTMWWYANREGYIDRDAMGDDMTLFTQRMLPGLAVYGALIIVGWFVPVIALGGYAVIAIVFIFPFRISRLYQMIRASRNSPRTQ